MTERKSFPLTVPIVFILLMLLGTFGLTYIVGLLTGSAQLEISYLTVSLLSFSISILLSLRIIYQVDRRSSRIKKRIGLFEPVGDDR